MTRRLAALLFAVSAVPLVASATPPTPPAGPDAPPPSSAMPTTPPSSTPAPESGQPATAVAPAHAVIPLPVSIELTGGAPFVVTPDTRILVPPGNDQARLVGRHLSDFIAQSVAQERPRVEPFDGEAPAGTVQFRLGTVAGAGDEGYELTVTADRVTVTANTPVGLFYGMQTLRQLLPPFLEHRGVLPGAGGVVSAPAVRITDRPRFAWRGTMLDVARHFLPVADVKRYIDFAAMYKLNYVHLHLTDDQGWRLEIKSWPNLAKHGGSTQVGGGPGGYYTQEQYADIVKYARDRFITIVPEIEMPTHINAALASYPELNCDGKAPALYTGIEVGFSSVCVDKEITYKFIDDVMKEVAALTPGPYIHMGGDEVTKLNDEQYATFVERVLRMVTAHGKIPIGWDEIAQATMPPGTIVQHWRPKNVPARAVAKGAKVILSPANKIYFDMKYTERTPIGLKWAAIVEVADAYSWDPLTMFEGLTEESILGVESAIWSETLATIRDFEFMAFPRFPGAAEIMWSKRDARQWDEFKTRLAAQAPRWTALGIVFYRSPTVSWPQ